jgi:putative transposase
MGIKRTKSAVYDLKYHLVWITKYRKKILNGEVTEYLKVVFEEIAQEYEFEIDPIGIKEDHVHSFLGAPPRYSPAELVQIMKSILAREVFKKIPKLKNQL